MTTQTGKRRACIECGHVRAVDWQGVCTTCAEALDDLRALEKAVRDRDKALASCKSKPARRLHLLDKQ